MNDPNFQVAVLIPCRDEETTGTGVVAGFHATFPQATVDVYDNGSGDQTVARALFEPVSGQRIM